MEKNKDKNNGKKEHLNVVVYISTFLLVVVGVALIGYYAFGNEPEEIQGQVDARQYRVSTKLTARIVKVMVEEGDYVHRGDTLAILEVPEVSAQERAAEATEGAARAVSEMTDNGSRHEEKTTTAELLHQAEAALTIARKTYDRMQALFDEGVISEQKRDEALAAYQVAKAQVEAARSQNEMTENGARREQRKAAAEQARAAGSGVDVVRSLLRETVQTASEDGEVDKIFAHEGELVSSGTPIMSINMLGDMWGKFNIRESRLDGMHMGSVVTAYSPTTGKDYRLRVYYIKDEDEFATWKAVKPDEGYDEKTFEVRARPMSKTTGLRPGMLLVMK